MNREEKQKHDNEISNRFILKADYKESDLDSLSIQDMCVLVNNSKYASSKHLIADDEKMNKLIKKFYEKLVDKVKEAEVLYTVIDKNTTYPFIDENAQNCIWIFSCREYADEAVDYFAQQYRNFTVMKVNREVKRDIFQELYLNGVNGVYIDNGYTGCVIKKEDLLTPPNYENTPAINIPITNPEFMLAHIKMRQEISWGVNYEKREEVLDKLEAELSKKIADAKFLVPVKGMPKAGNETGEMVLSKDTTISIPSIQGKNGEEGMPVFTDWKQFRLVYSDEEFNGWIMTLKDLQAMIKDKESAVILINFGRCMMELNEKNIERLKNILSKNDAKSKSEEKKEENIQSSTENNIEKENENKGVISKLKNIFK